MITSLAGFEVAFAFPLVERFSGLGLRLGLGGSGITGIAGFATPESVITSLAGFGAHRPQPLGGRTAIPAAFRTDRTDRAMTSQEFMRPEVDVKDW